MTRLLACLSAVVNELWTLGTEGSVENGVFSAAEAEEGATMESPGT